MNGFIGSRLHTERSRNKVVTALLLVNLVGGTAAVLARANMSNAPVAAAHTTTTMATAPTTTTTTAHPADCGQGSASARAVLTRAGDVYDLSTRVTNQTDRPIEIDRLAVRAVYPDGTKELSLPTADLRVETESMGAEASFPVPGGQSATRPSSFEIAEFRFHPAGQPECTSY